MKYTVEYRTRAGESHYSDPMSRRQAEKEARKSSEYDLIFVSWYRKSDGQHGYLNPDGNHAIIGKSWKEKRIQ
jgi:hypothetical protein